MSSTGPNLLCSTLLLALGTLLFPALAKAAEQEPGTLQRAQGETVARAALPADHAQKMTRGLETFQSKVRGLLVEHCLKCHGGEKTKGEFSVATRESLLKGGEEGVAVVAFQAKASRLLRLIQHAEEPHMPDKGPKLGLDAIALIASWIDDGAPYDRPLVEGQVPTRERGAVTAADREWWSFRPLSKPAPPPAPNPPAGAQDGGRDGNGNSIDRFIVAKAATQHLALAPRAERHVLIRRAYLDLLGLPPPPEAVAAFVSDPSPEAWPRLIDTLLASPRYGERWARHWLDLARFAESSGFEHDYDREGAFHYRDFVIKALNMDLPFEQFVRWQVAGDEFEPENPLALAATGFLGAGVFPTQITANEVERTRYDALDDMLSTTGSTFLGLSIGCARCHDHKYDPIPALDYYRMLSTFTTTTRSVVDLDVEPEKTRQQIRRWETEHAPLQSELNRSEESLRPRFAAWLTQGAPLPASAWTLLELTNLSSRAGAKFKKLDDGSYLAEGKNGDEDVYTFISAPISSRITGVRLDALPDPSLKKSGPGRADNGNIGLSRIRVTMLASNGARQELSLSKAVADFEQNKESLSIAAALDDNPKTGWAVDPQFGKEHHAVFTLSKPVEPGEGVCLEVRLEFQLNTRHNIGRPRLAVTGEPAPALDGEVVPNTLARLLGQDRSKESMAALTETERTVLFDWWKQRDGSWRERKAALEEHAQKKPDGRTKVLICAEGYTPLRMHTQGADFIKETYVLKRGNTDLKNGVAVPGFLQVLMPASTTPARWHWAPPPEAKFSGRRRALANWLTDTEQGGGALLARVAANRLWQHHFGQGIVATPSDFGRTGTPPTHPELLDWLAGTLIEHGWRLKDLHRLIMTSATYQQSSGPDKAKAAADPFNQLWTRRLPRRLEGEVIRDSLLAVSGQLDTTMFGKGTKDEKSKRRSIYFTIKRSQLVGSMVAFDQPEPLVSQGARPVTTVAPQALFLLNAPSVRDWALAFAQRVMREAEVLPGSDIAGAARACVVRAIELTLGRPATVEEVNDALAFLSAQEAGYRAEGRTDSQTMALADYGQVLFGLNEFAYEN